LLVFFQNLNKVKEFEMLVNPVLGKVAPFVPVVGSAYGFGKTCIEIYSSTSPSRAIVAGVKSVVINCTPPVIKYPALCAVMLACGGAACVTGDPNFAFGAIECATEIVKG
jgi:hypothetical protein